MPSENGWEPARAVPGYCVWGKVPGVNVSLELHPEIAVLMRAFAADYNAYVEPLRDPDSCGYTPTNSVATSNHLNGTAYDLNWNSHPFKVKGTFTAKQVTAFRDLQEFYEGWIFWAGDWKSPIDEMHWQMNYGTYARRSQFKDFIARKIQADGFSTYKRQPSVGGTSEIGLTAETLHYVMRSPANNQSPLSVARYAEILPHYRKALAEMGCNTLERVAQNIAQLGHESVGFRYREEIWGPTAAQRGYEGRIDLGNTRSGDGYRFRGRGYIQVTGRNNYAKLSQWAYSRGLVPTPTYFVDDPDALAADEHSFTGVIWYWTDARPMNSLIDAGDNAQWGSYRGFNAVTAAINGGTNGLTDRINRYNNAKAVGWNRLNPQPIGGFLMALTDAQQAELYAQICGKRPSRSPYATPGEPARYTSGDYSQTVDGVGNHMEFVETSARDGNLDSIQRLARTAGGQGIIREPWIVSRATRILNEILAANPEFIKAATGVK